MSIDITLPELGDGLDSGDVLNILVAAGDVVQVEQGIIELETEKAVAEVPSTHAGRVIAVHVKVGETVPIGAPLITIEPTEVEPAKVAAVETPVSEPAPAEAAPDVATQTEPATHSAPPAEPAAARPAKPTRAAPAVPVAQATAGPDAPAADSSGAPAGPAVRRFARELGVDLTNVNGTGPDGRITKQDVRSAVRRATQSAVISAVQTVDATPPAASELAMREAVTPPGQPSSDDWGPVIVDRVTKIRSTIAAKMVQSKSTAPHVTNFDDADVTELEQIRQSSKKDYSDAGVRLTTMPFIIKAVAQALRKHPVVNASLDLDAGQIIYKQYVNVGIAVDTERGLMVPVVCQPDRLSIAQIARALSEMAEKARTNKITVNDMRGGNFTISNLGAIGGTYSTPVINTPEVAILLTGRSREMPVVVDGDVEIRLMMPLSLSYDHRLVDGAAAARFLNEIKGYLEAPGRLLLAP